MRPEDVPAVTDLFQRAFGRPMTTQHYFWKLRTRPSPTANVSIAVDDQDRPVFHIGAVPGRLRAGENEYWVMVAVDGMTDPAWRRRGVLTRVTADLFDRWRQAGVALVLGLPNEQWRSRIGVLGWRHLFPLQWLVRPILPERLLARRLGVGAVGRAAWVGRLWNRWWNVPVRGVELDEITHAGTEWDSFWADVRRGIGTSLVRDADWINWRYLHGPEEFRVFVVRRDGKPAGFAAMRVREGSAVIGEVLTARTDMPAFAALVGHVVRTLALEGVAVVRALAVPETWPYEAFRRLGFFRSRHSFGVHGVVLDPAVSEALVRDGSRWFLAGGDFDVV